MPAGLKADLLGRAGVVVGAAGMLLAAGCGGGEPRLNELCKEFVGLVSDCDEDYDIGDCSVVYSYDPYYDCCLRWFYDCAIRQFQCDDIDPLTPMQTENAYCIEQGEDCPDEYIQKANFQEPVACYQELSECYSAAPDDISASQEDGESCTPF